MEGVHSSCDANLARVEEQLKVCLRLSLFIYSFIHLSICPSLTCTDTNQILNCLHTQTAQAALDKQAAQSKREIGSLNAMIEDLRAKLAASEKARDGLQTNKTSLEGNLKELHKELDDEESDLGALRKKLKETEALLDVARKEADDMHASYEVQSKELFEKTSNLNHAEERIKEIEAELDALRAKGKRAEELESELAGRKIGFI